MPKEDVVQFRFQDVSQSAFLAEQLAVQYCDRITGAGNAMMGQPDDFARTNATMGGTIFLAQQGSKLFESSSKNVEEGMGEVGLFILYQLIFHSDKVRNGILKMLPEAEQELLLPILDLNVEDIPSNFSISVRVTDIDQTEEARLQKAMTMMQLQDLYTDRTIAMGERIAMLQQQMPQLVEPALKLYVARTKLMEEVYELLKVTDPESFTVYVKDMDFILRQQEAVKNAQLMEVEKREQSRGNGQSISSEWSGGIRSSPPSQVVPETGTVPGMEEGDVPPGVM
jgi:hypothetical protein